MKQFSKLMLLAFGFGLLGVVLSSLSNHPVAAQGSSVPVTVVNTAARPVPVSYPTTPTVNIGTLPPIAGSVSIAGQPLSVNVANTPSLTEQGTPFAQQLCFVSGAVGGCFGAQPSFTVGSNQHLIIEYVSAFCVLNGGTNGNADVNLLDLTVVTGGVSVFHAFGPFFQGQLASTGQTLYFQVAQQTRLYADPSSTVLAAGVFGQANDGSLICRVSLSGRMTTP